MVWLFWACVEKETLFEESLIDWENADIDQDGWTIAEGDCWEIAKQPPQIDRAQRHFLSAKDIHPEAEDLPYDGIDQNCDGRDDFDADGDGFVPEKYENIQTLNVEESGFLPAGDCWDGGSIIPQDFQVLNNFEQLTPEQVNPEAQDRFYDGVNQDCGSEIFEFDQDQDGDNSKYYVDHTGRSGGDCVDSMDDLDMLEIDTLQPADIHSHQEETYYDGIDQNCDSLNDYDQDGDGFAAFEYEGSDCNDHDPDIHVLATEAPVDGIDQDCDGLERCYIDADHDEYGGSMLGLSADLSCLAEGFSNLDSDCNDVNALIYPFAQEHPEGSDTNCDGLEEAGIDVCFGRWNQGKYFLSCEAQVLYAEAESLCQDHGYDGLTWIKSEAENEYIVQGLTSLGRYWIGLTDQATEGIFVWQASSGAASFFNWGGGQPDNLNNQDCVSISNFGWYDEACTSYRRFICQIR